MTVRIIVFSKPSCVQCTYTQRALEKYYLYVDNGDYDVVDISTDKEAYRYAVSLGHLTAPIVVVAEAGVTIEQLMDPEHPAAPIKSWGGFKPDLINKLFKDYPSLSRHRAPRHDAVLV